MKIYITGPTNRELRVTLESFDHWEKKIQQYLPDVTVVNPTNIDTNLPWGDYKNERIQALSECKVVIMLDYWSQSNVASTEFIYAVEHNIQLFFQNDFHEMVCYCRKLQQEIYNKHFSLH
jgi:hypothetical protein